MIAQRAGFTVVYSDDDLPVGRRVRLRAESMTVVAALTDVLFDAGVDVVFNKNGGAAIVKRPPAMPMPVIGTITGWPLASRATLFAASSSGD